MIKTKQSLSALALCMMLSACASLDNREFSESALETTGQNLVWQEQDSNAINATQLTDLVNINAIPHMSSFIEEALSNNANLQQILITLRKAQVAIDSKEADDNINLGINVNANKVEQEDTNYTSNFNISWELDLWQKINDGISAANFQAASAKANYQAARDSLVANVIRSYIDVLTQQQLLKIEQERLEVLENNQEIILNRYRTGLGSLDDLDNARTSSANTRSSIAQYEYTLATAKRTLAVLLGRQDQTLNELTTESEFPDVLLPLATLPKQDLARRPDLQAAYYTLKASEYNVDVAYKSLLPSINLSAALTDSANSPTEALFTNPVWSLLGQITAPLFQGGALRAQIDDAKLSSLNAWWQYRETLLNAVQETQNTLDNERTLAQRITHTATAIENAERSVETTAGNYRQGLADILDLLSVYNTRFNLQLQQVQLQASQLQNRIDLGLALGLGVSQ